MPINLFNILNGVAGAKPPAGTRGGWVDYNIKCNTKNMDIILTFV